MSYVVPFDPPYVKKLTGEEGDRWVEVLIDGTEVPCAAPSPWPLQTMDAVAPTAMASTVRVSKITLLNVPYAEKDEAKQLGAKWDATRKKWFVPVGVDVEPFSRWTTG